MNRKPPTRRNPLARSAKKLRPKVVPDKRRKKLAAMKRREVEVETEKSENI